ncbi:MAG: RluA family pseudouridine synthase [Bacteroidetes bacterium]|nr:RluA family pseudouridine synthase [Bacteroidota bacterium]
MDSKNHHKKSNKPKQETRFVVSEETELMKFLLENLTHKNRNNIKSLLRDRQIYVDGKITTQFNHLLKPEQIVEVIWERIPVERQYRGISIIFEDQHLIVIDKHSGTLSIATDTEKKQTAYSMLSEHVKLQNPDNKIFVVHRLDRETSGLMMFAKNENVQKLLQETWQETISERTYLAIIEGELDPPQGTYTSYLRESKALKMHSSQIPGSGEKAITHFKTLKSSAQFSLVKVNLETGKKNQIRVHLQDIGHPIIGDKKYGSEINPIGRLGLHAWVLSFKHPITERDLHFETNIPAKFSRLI